METALVRGMADQKCLRSSQNPPQQRYRMTVVTDSRCFSDSSLLLFLLQPPRSLLSFGDDLAEEGSGTEFKVKKSVHSRRAAASRRTDQRKPPPDRPPPRYTINLFQRS